LTVIVHGENLNLLYLNSVRLEKMKTAALSFIACRPQKEKNIAELYVVNYDNGG